MMGDIAYCVFSSFLDTQYAIRNRWGGRLVVAVGDGGLVDAEEFAVVVDDDVEANHAHHVAGFGGDALG